MNKFKRMFAVLAVFVVMTAMAIPANAGTIGHNTANADGNTYFLIESVGTGSRTLRATSSSTIYTNHVNDKAIQVKIHYTLAGNSTVQYITSNVAYATAVVLQHQIDTPAGGTPVYASVWFGLTSGGKGYDWNPQYLPWVY